MAYERDIALRDAHEVSAADAFFAARPHLDTTLARRLYEDGFRVAWRLNPGAALAQARPPAGEPVADVAAALERRFVAEAIKGARVVLQDKPLTRGSYGAEFWAGYAVGVDEVEQRIADEQSRMPPPTEQPDSTAREALTVARQGYVSMRATGQPCLPVFIDRAIDIIDRALADRSGTERTGSRAVIDLVTIPRAELLDTADIAAWLGVTRAHVTDRLTKQPGFPKPAVNLSRRLRRWRRADVAAYLGLELGRDVLGAGPVVDPQQDPQVRMTADAC